MNMLKTLLGAGALSLVAGAASAATVENYSTEAPEDSCVLTNFTTSIACNGNFTTTGQGGGGGNVSAGDINPLFYDGDVSNPIDDWMLVSEISSADLLSPENSLQSVPENEGDAIFEIMVMAVEGDEEEDSFIQGMWRLAEGSSFDPDYFYAFSIKGSTDQAVYVMDTSIDDGAWKTMDLLNNGENFPGLSNIQLWKAPGNMTPIPLPAAGWLLLGGLGGLYAMKRRRKS